jgi:hypothetical protein
MALAEIGPLLRDDFSAEHMTWLVELANALERDGLAVVAENEAPYSTEEPAGIRLRLP